MSSQQPDRVCENCGRWVERNEVLYRVRLEIFAEPTLNLEEPLEPEELSRRKWDDLIQQLEMMSDEQVQEATDQVHERFEYNLCTDCRKEMHRRIKTRKELL